MNVEIAVKNIKYTFENDSTFQSVRAIAEKTASELYQEEQDFQKDEYETMLADGDVSDYKEYCDAVGIGPSDVDYRKPFSDNIAHPQIKRQIEELTNQYMCNVCDLPKNAVVSINAAAFDKKGHLDKSTRGSLSQSQQSSRQQEVGAVIPKARQGRRATEDNRQQDVRDQERQAAVRAALQEKFGSTDVVIAGFESVGDAEKKDILSQNAYEKVGEMIKSNDFQSYLDLRASIEKYSSKNISLIYYQKPDAKAVMGYNAWKRLDRHVGAGQNGISIWQPCKHELKTEEQVDNYIKNNSARYGEPDSKKAVKAKEKLMAEIEKNGIAEVDMGFRLGKVFDVSQTAPNDLRHDNIMDIVNLNKPLSQDLDNYDAVVVSMKDAATLAPFSIPQDLSQQDGACGGRNRGVGTTPTTKSGGQQDGLFEAVIAYADKLLANTPDKVSGIKSPEPFTGDMHTIETTLSAYLICVHIGIECADKAGLRLAEIFDSDKLTEQSVKVGKREMFLKSFDRACCVSDQFNKAFDKSFGYDLEARREAAIKEAEERRAREEAEQKALRENRVYFGTTPMQKHDMWEKDGIKYLVAQNEKNNAFYVRMFPDKKCLTFVYLKGDEGKAKRFDTPPSRETVERLYECQRIEAELRKDPDLHPDDAKMAAKIFAELKKPKAADDIKDDVGVVIKSATGRCRPKAADDRER